MCRKYNDISQLLQYRLKINGTNAEKTVRADRADPECLGMAAVRQGEWDAATEAFSDALTIARQTGVRVQVAEALHGLAHAAALLPRRPGHCPPKR